MIGESCKTQVTELNGIAIPNRLRALKQEKIDSLAESMSQQGLLHPILVRPRSGTGFTLIAGWHRLEAARQLKWDTIRVEIREGISDEQAELCEIDENLIRGELGPAETALHHARRKELYLIVHPEKARGKAPGAGRGRGKRPFPVFSFDDPPAAPLEERKNCALPNYAEQAAAETGSSKRTVEMAVARGRIPGLASLVGTCLDRGNELDALTKLPENEQRVLMARVVAGEELSAKTRLKQIDREKRERDLAEKTVASAAALKQEVPASVIVIDWALRFDVWSEKGESRSAENHYPCGTVEEMAVLKPPMADDVVVFAWTTAPQLENTLAIGRQWGLKYKSYIGWDKEIDGTGYWSLSRLELILIFTRGQIPAPAPGQQFPQVYRSRRRSHSEKPDELYRDVERLYPNLVKLEMFARKERPGWRTWGNEAEDSGVAASTTLA
jgi:N6-adenosine-specific RNA methylase IME4